MKSAWLIKIVNYEYWPMWTFYLPLFPYFFIKGIMNGHLFYFTNVNPGIDQYGGLFFDSKHDIDRLFPGDCRPLSILINPISEKAKIDILINSLNLNFPLIAKPDSGERGEGVIKITNSANLHQLFSTIRRPYLIQEFIDYPKEYGVFIAYIPQKSTYKVISLTEKIFFNVKGNGVHSIKELILKRERGKVFYENLKERSEYAMTAIPAKGENCVIHKLGNHCNGTEFINRNALISTEMDNAFNSFLQSIDGIQYGRFDIKVQDFEDLISFKNLKIIEFNGVAAEPIHIYDSSVGYINALKSFISHWELLSKIAIDNKKKGFKSAKYLEVINKIRLRISSSNIRIQKG